MPMDGHTAPGDDDKPDDGNDHDDGDVDNQKNTHTHTVTDFGIGAWQQVSKVRYGK